MRKKLFRDWASFSLLVMGFLAGFGALLGAAGGLMMNRFFKNVLKL